jgi:hypothetical protein
MLLCMYRKILLVVLCTIQAFSAPPIDKVVIWGHKLHSHTHSYIHERFFRAFQHMGYATYWFDDNDDVHDFDFTHSLFITEGQADGNIPIRFDCQYVIHNCENQKYKPLFDASICVTLQVFTEDVLTRPGCRKIAPCIYYDVAGKCVYIPWASDFLPEEIEMMKERVGKTTKKNYVHWIGTIGGGIFGNEDQLNDFKRACNENGIRFKHNSPWGHGIDRDEYVKLITPAYLAPAIVGKWQQEKGYIPCRIFISICCGQMGVTNSNWVYELFDKKITYNPDCYQLFYDAKERQETWTVEDQLALMDLVKEKHTYINRIQTLLEFLQLANL